MSDVQSLPWLRYAWPVPLVLLGAATLAAAAPETAVPPKNKAALPPLAAAFKKVTPETIDDLKHIEERVQLVLKKVMPAVVGVRVGPGQGSGVIISADGYVLTAAHVSGPSGRIVEIVLPSGRVVKGKTLGNNKRIDDGLIKLVDSGPWPHVEMGNSADLHRGDWCIAIGHPGGYRQGRTAPVRLGRVLDNFRTLIRTDCTLVGGDSGGPLFDMNGKVIGIHSRIGPAISYNIHVPVDSYRDDWDRLVSSEIFPSNVQPYLGVQGDPDSDSCKLFKIYPNSPAARAGLKENDVIVRFAGKDVISFEDLVNMVARQRPGAQVAVAVRRGSDTIIVSVTIGQREDS